MPKHRRDTFGDPLPQHALSRFGTLRFRPTDLVRALALSPSGRLIATGGSDRIVTVWDAVVGTEVRRLVAHRSTISCLAFLETEMRLASGDDAGQILLWSIDKENETAVVLHQLHDSIASILGARGGQLLLAITENGVLQLIDLDVTPPKSILEKVVSSSCKPALAQDHLASALKSEPSAVEVLHISSGEAYPLCDCGGALPEQLALSPDGKHVAALCDDGLLRAWESRNGLLLCRLRLGRGSCLAFSEDGSHLFWYDRIEHRARWWRTGTNRVEGEVSYQCDGRVVALCLAAHRIASCDIGGSIQIADLRTGASLVNVPGHASAVTSIAFCERGSSLMSAGVDCTLRLWDLASTAQMRIARLHARYAMGVGAVRGGKSIVSGGLDGAVRLWDATTLEKLGECYTHGSAIVGLATDANGAFVASIDMAGTVIIWDALSRRIAGRFTCKRGPGRAVAISAQGTVVIAADADNEVYCWRVSNQQRTSVASHDSTITSVSLSSDCSCLLLTGLDNIFSLVDIDRHRPLFKCEGTSGTVLCCALAPVGRLAAIGEGTIGLDTMQSGTVSVWDLGSRKLVRRFEGHRGRVRSVAFRRAEPVVASGSADGTIVLWKIE